MLRGNRARRTVRTPVLAPWDYVLIIIAFLVGLRRRPALRRTAALVSGACLRGVLLNAEVIIDFAFVSGRSEYQATGLTKNQTALLRWSGRPLRV